MLQLRWIFLFVFIPFLLGAQTDSLDYLKGLNAYQSGQFEQAINQFKMVLRDNPNNWQAQQMVGNCYYRLNDTKNCLEAFKSSIQIHPENPPLQNFIDSLRNSFQKGLTIAAPQNPTPTESPISGGMSPDNPPETMETMEFPPDPTSMVSITTDRFNTASRPNNGSASMPVIGHLSWVVGLSYWFSNQGDFVRYLGPLFQSSGTSSGLENDLGVDVCLGERLTAGFRLQYLARSRDELDNSNQPQRWVSDAWGGALGGSYGIPLDRYRNLVLHAEFGLYSMNGSIFLLQPNSGIENICSTNVGFLVSEDIEFVFGKNDWALDVGIGYRYLDFSPLKASGTVNGVPITPTHLLDYYGKSMALDYSGFQINTIFKIL